jgi:acetyltransferase-like isoleucine patch superfamily enzyme
MGYSFRRRLGQTIWFGWKDAGSIANNKKLKRSRVGIYFDILSCFRKYYVYSKQYLANAFYAMTDSERKPLAEKIGASNRFSDDWADDYYINRRFLRKYSSFKYETSLKLTWKRRDAYRKRYNMGENCAIQNNVILSREHFLPGSISIGNNVLLAKNVFIDYSGDIIIKDNVHITNGVIIETHHHAYHSDPNLSNNIIKPSKLIIEEGVVIGSRAIILASCHYIGRNSRIGAGAVVTKDIPDNVIAVGVPAKVIKSFSPIG